MKKAALTAGMLAMIAGLSGCTTYYRITDPSTEKSYFTTKYEKEDGAIEFTDAKSGSMVNIQNAEISEISGDEYKSNTGG